MKTLRQSFYISFILILNISAQDKLLTVEDVILGSFTRFAPTSIRQLSWLPETDNYVYVEGNGETSALLKSSIKSSRKDTLTTLKKLNINLNRRIIKS